jgi:hypothetical protein
MKLRRRARAISFHVRAYFGGYACLSHRCVDAHTMRRGCLLRPPGKGTR